MTQTASTRSANTSELQIGDIVRTYGMRVRVEHVATYEDRGTVWSCAGTVLNPDEVKAAGFVPTSFLRCHARTEAVRPEVREAHVKSHDHGTCWTIQGNELARWHVEAKAERCDTIGCKLPAEYEITYNYRGEEEVSTDLACGPCADGYSRRPVLKNFQRTPILPA
jgi:hypothetical protein